MWCVRRLLVVVGESKVLVVDLVGRRVREVPKALLEGKTPTCVAFLFQGGAVSCDGHLQLHACWSATHAP